MGCREAVRPLLLLPALALLGLAAGACGRGGAGSPARSARAVSTPTAALTSSSNRLRGDEDDDDLLGESKQTEEVDSDSDTDNDVADRNAHRGFYDTDDRRVRGFGRPAKPAERRAIAALVKRYYAAALAGDGATGCALTTAGRAESLYEDDAQTYSPGATTCPPILAGAFRAFHSQLTAPVRVLAVRVQGRRALATLGSPVMRASFIQAKYERGAWKIDNVLARRLP
jgi:hypothetical protein